MMQEKKWQKCQYFISIQPLVLWAANLLPEISDMPILIALCAGLYNIYKTASSIDSLYLTYRAKYGILGI